jgi:hypothetical protein
VATLKQLEASLQGLLSASVTFSSGPARVLIGGILGDRLEGDLTDPGDPVTRLHFMADVVQIQRPKPKTVYLVFFAPEGGCDASRGLFERVQASVDLLA